VRQEKVIIIIFEISAIVIIITNSFQCTKYIKGSNIKFSGQLFILRQSFPNCSTDKENKDKGGNMTFDTPVLEESSND
jgi:hypothetical protein